MFLTVEVIRGCRSWQLLVNGDVLFESDSQRVAETVASYLRGTKVVDDSWECRAAAEIAHRLKVSA